MTDVADAIHALRTYADELDTLSRALGKVERDLEPVEAEYQAFVDDFEIGLWKKHEDDGGRLPSAAMRLKLAHKAMDPALLGRYVGLVNARKRGVERVRAVKASVEAQRSILSALRTEAEALR
jgi:hypothetical protein